MQKVKDFETKCYIKVKVDGEDGYRLNPITEIITHYFTAICMPSITKRNFEEFYFRMRIFDGCVGSIGMNGKGDHFSLSLQDIEDHIGMWSNAPTWTKSEFLKKMKKRLLDRYEKDHRHQW